MDAFLHLPSRLPEPPRQDTALRENAVPLLANIKAITALLDWQLESNLLVSSCCFKSVCTSSEGFHLGFVMVNNLIHVAVPDRAL